MKDVKKNLTEEAEPTIRSGATFLSMWILGLLGLVTWWGFTYIDARGGQFNEQVYEPYHSTKELTSFLPKDETAIAIKRGFLVYAQCQGCHQEDGLGQPSIAPPLAGSALAVAPAGVTTRILLNGKEGAVGLMPPVGGVLTDDQIAAVLTYVRRQWGNAGSPIDPDTTKNIRALSAGRARPWTEEELARIADGAVR